MRKLIVKNLRVGISYYLKKFGYEENMNMNMNGRWESDMRGYRLGLFSRIFYGGEMF